MTLKKLCEICDFEKVWEATLKEGLVEQDEYNGYKKAFEELRMTVPVESCDKSALKHIFVAKSINVFGDDPDESIWDVSGVQEEVTERYAIEMSPWAELLFLEVWPVCLEIYSKETVMGVILDELTFFGFDSQSQSERVGTETEILLQSVADYETHKDDEDYFVPIEKVFEHLGFVDERTEAEKEASMVKTRHFSVISIFTIMSILGTSKAYSLRGTTYDVSDEVLIASRKYLASGLIGDVLYDVVKSELGFDMDSLIPIRD